VKRDRVGKYGAPEGGPTAAPPEVRRRGRYRQLVELAPDGILIHDGERVLLANMAAARLAGAAGPATLIGARIETLLTPPHLKGVEARLLAPGILSGAVVPMRDTLRRVDGSTVEVEVTAIVFMDGRRTSVHLVIRDVTERLAAQHASDLVAEQLRQAQRMEAVGALAGGVAHEVNNMMSIILGFGEFMQQDATLPPQHIADLHEIVKAAERAAAVTRQLLAFSRRAFYRPEAFNLSAALAELEPVIGRLLGAGRTLVVTSNTARRLWADRGQFEQVMVNLALNARDAMPAAGTLSITVSEVEVTDGLAAYGGAGIPPGHYGRIAVRDTGTGMDAATAKRLFEPFFTTKPVGEGTGLGLAAVHGILKQNAAFVTVESEPGDGATFTLYYPAAPADAPERLIPGRPGSGQAGPDTRVLLVEDEPVVRAVAARSLAAGGYVVLQASDGTTALEVIDREGIPAVVLTDLMMPGMGGAELGRALRSRYPGVPIVFMSGYSADDLRRQGAIGADEVTIQKPFTPDELLDAVAAALRQAELAGPGPVSDASGHPRDTLR
jgi:PAS domain S-box-containing protein